MKLPKMFTLLALIAGGFGAGYALRATRPATAPTTSRRILYYVDPMHPSYKSDKPGTAPDCGMSLEAVYAEGAADGSASAGAPAAHPAGVVQIGQERQQRIGVRTSLAEKMSATHSIRLFGRVAADETKVYKLVSGMDGTVRRISA